MEAPRRDHLPRMYAEQFQGRGRQAGQVLLGHLEHRLDQGLVTRLADQSVGGALPTQQTEGLSQEGLARARLPGQHGQPRTALEDSVLDQHEIADGE